MTYNIWEKRLSDELKALPEKERDEICDYYRELYGDRAESGLANDEILKNFGDPETVAALILKERGADKSAPTAPKSDTIPKRRKITAASIIGWFFLSVCIIIPFAAVIISAFAAFLAVAVTGAALLVAGPLAAIASPVGFFFGLGGIEVLVFAGMSLGAGGVGAFLFPIFYTITKYFAVSIYKLMKHFIKGGKKNEKIA